MTLPNPTSPIVLRPGEGRFVTIGTKSRCTFKVVGKDTNGRFGLFEYAMDPGAEGAKPHIHHTLTEIFYVAEGEVHLQAGNQRMIGRPGTLVLVPPETVHGFANPGPQPSVLLIMFCPADSREQYFEGLAELTKDGKRPDSKALLELMRRFDQESVDEP